MSTLNSTDLALLSAGPSVTVAVHQLADGRAFKHMHPLESFTVALQTSGYHDANRWGDQVWEHMVYHYLLPTVPATVTIRPGSYNPTWIRLVDGLTNNTARIEHHQVLVEATKIAVLYKLAAAGKLTSPPKAPDVTPKTVQVDGLNAFAGRRVDIEMAGSVENPSDILSGTFLHYTDGFIFISNSAYEELAAVNAASVVTIRTSQLSDAEHDTLS